jgi:UDP-N-acetylmuramoyl-L-alanyl-D-glutamate--2,6-diaminopimelate ligase
MLLTDLHTQIAPSCERVGSAANPEILEVFIDSREVKGNSLFSAIEGAQLDGHQFIEAAQQNGAIALLGSNREILERSGLPCLLHPEPRKVLGKIAAELQNDPSASMKVVGITGTNGKTSSVEILANIQRGNGHAVGTIGTLGASYYDRNAHTGFTTPEAPELQRTFARMRDAGCQEVVMEVSSHGLSMERVQGTEFAVGAFTNLSQDHLDFHGDMKSYGETKARLFTEHLQGSANCKGAVINIDDPFGARLADRVRPTEVPLFPVSRSAKKSSLGFVQDVQTTPRGMSGTLVLNDSAVPFSCKLVGDHNLENILVAAGCSFLLGSSAEEIAGALSHIQPSKGRFEPIENPFGLSIFVDYAHTPDALRRSLSTLRTLVPGRVICVFGCGGDRDRDKRPKMGKAAMELSDAVFLTSDNPRTEDPQRIAEDAMVGIREAGGQPLTRTGSGFTMVLDRAEAIRAALASATPDDGVLIAGKGHEDYQVIGTETRPFSDQDCAKEAVHALYGVGE